MTTHRSPRLRLLAFALTVSLAGAASAEDLRSLRKEYEEAKAKAGGQPKDRAEKVQKTVVPLLEKIGALDTKESLAFLLGELKAAPPEIGAACAGPILASSHDGALKLLLQAAADRPPAVKAGVLAALERTKADLSGVAAEVLHFAQGAQDPEAKRALPPVLARLGTVAAAKAILAGVQPAKASRGGEDPQAAYNSRAAAALGGMKSEEVKAWLAEGAFAAAGSDPAKCAAVARAAGELRLEGARKGLEKLVGHASNDVALAAISALTRVGVGEATAGIAQALERRKGKGDATFMIQALDALATAGTDEAVEVVVKFAQGSDPEARTIAMGSLALAPQSPKAVAALTKGLADDDPVVRLAALKGLGRHRDKAMVEPLIELLGREKEERLKANALEILVPLTNQNMGLVYEDWKKWWEANGDRFELPKGDGEKGTTQVKARDLSYFGIEVSSKRLSFLVDISSSMTQEMTVTRRTGKDDDPLEPSKGKTEVKGGRKGGGGGGGGGAPGGGEATKMKRIDVLKRELVRILKKLPADTQVNIITFNRTHKAWQDQLQPLAGGGRDKAVKFVEGLQTGTGTNVFDTVEAALKDKRVDTLYLLTDGEPTAGRITQPQAILEEVRNQNKGRRATIHCIGFGEDSAFLRDLARLNGGDYRFVNEY